MSEGPAIVRGAILAYRVFDAGEQIALDVAEKLVPGGKRLELASTLAEGLVIAVRPLEIALAECEIAVPGIEGPVRARCSARVFDFGAVSVLYEIAIEPGTTVAALTPICDALYDAPELDAHGAEHRDEIVKLLGPAIEKAHAWREAESYTIVFAEELRGCTVETLVRSEAVAKLLLGERSERALADSAREDVLKTAFSYLADDLVIVDWNSALVVEPGGSRVVPRVLELATCQLLEFRYYDGLLDRELAKVYDDVERSPRILKSPFSALTRQVLRRYMELTEFTERVDNAIKSVGDFYLARVYTAALGRFRIPEWRESVESKLGLVGRVYELLKGEVEVSRTQILEIIVIVLIALEVVNSLRH
ncbi:MAG: hypothetical protein KIT84_05680 [Labilithrix sp.]|nr:hypothetical protein [Labilithrix sp.]MCW5810479.1 hypothetical protein [Labilithrix sp.]